MGTNLDYWAAKVRKFLKKDEEIFKLMHQKLKVHTVKFNKMAKYN